MAVLKKMCVFGYLYLILPACISGDETYDNDCPYKGCECVNDILGCGAQNWKTLPPLLSSQYDGKPSLDLQGNPLSVIPAGSLPSGVSEINFQGNPISSIDDTAFNGSSDTLHQLTFTGALFTQIPTALNHLYALTSLVLEDTQIKDWNLDTLKHIGSTMLSLTLDNVGLSSWPTWIQYFIRLQELQLTASFTSVPSNALDMQTNTLTIFKLENGFLTEVPVFVSKLVALKRLLLDNNKISRITSLPNFGNLTDLSLNNNSLTNATQLSQSLHSVSGSLIYLRLQGNQLTAMPDVSFLTKVVALFMSDNVIQDTGSGSIPSTVANLEMERNNLRSLKSFLTKAVHLNTLKLGMNSIASISGIDVPSSVVELDLTKNLISELTDTSFPQESKMDSLTLDVNPIVKISLEAFAGLTQLRYLSLRSTRLTRLPIALRYLEGLMVLNMSQNSGLVCTCLEKVLGLWSLENEMIFFGDCGQSSIKNFLNVLSADCPN